MTKIAGSGSESGSRSISQRHGSADPDPHQNVMVLEHWRKCSVLSYIFDLSQLGLQWMSAALRCSENVRAQVQELPRPDRPVRREGGRYEERIHKAP
jgi:hypothetical protein